MSWPSECSESRGCPSCGPGRHLHPGVVGLAVRAGLEPGRRPRHPGGSMPGAPRLWPQGPLAPGRMGGP